MNFNGGDYVQGALSSLAVQTRRDFEVILVDNGSKDGSIDELDTSDLPAFTLLAETENHGFACGNNIAAEIATGKWLVLLNPDAAAEPDWLDKISDGISRHPNVSSFASTQISMHTPDRLDGAGDNYLIWGIPWRGGFERPLSECPAEGECFSPCGAGAVYNRKTFLSYGGFDERFFCFCEDVDLGYRMRLGGDICIFLPDAKIHHAGGGLSGQASPFSIRHGARNRLWTYVKNTPMALLILTLPIHILLTFGILLRGIMTGRFRSTSAGILDALRNLGPVWQQRRQLQSTRRVSLAALAQTMAWNPALLLRRAVVVKSLRR